jgi:gamma-glutamyltranspeptidase
MQTRKETLEKKVRV